ncbi:hypothetical protein [Pseudoxanthomonas putridarboris]|uniref:Pilus assembly protein n=1 Tax=Pseudoxanthomonas putridarboris TaxID=752605 RepID=A0ABU9J6G0_9GAMM
MNRWKASGLHLLLSLLVIGGIALCAFLAWYPYGLYRIAGQDRLLLIMLGIDLVAGPLLTLVVYKTGKPSLRFDLAVIALCQLGFLGYGLHTLWQSRPVFLVASDMRFNLVFANEIDSEALAEAPRPEWRRLSWLGPQLVGVRPPEDEKQRQDLLFAFMSTGVDLDKLPRYYVAYTGIAPELLSHAEDPWRSESGEIAGGKVPLRKVPVVSRYNTGWMLVDARTGRPVRVMVE